MAFFYVMYVIYNAFGIYCIVRAFQKTRNPKMGYTGKTNPKQG